MNDNQLSDLILFNKKTELLKNSSFYDSMIKKESSFMFSWNQGGAPESILISSSQESVDALLLTLRMFLQNNDRISVRNIYKKIYTECDYLSDLSEKYSLLRIRFNDYLYDNNGLNFFDKHHTNMELIDLFLYGDKGHSNRNKQSALNKLMSHGEIISKLIYYSFEVALACVIQFIIAFSKINVDAIALSSDRT